MSESVFIVETQFQIHEILLPYKEEMVQYFFNNIKKQNDTSYSVFYTNPIIENKILPSVKQIVKESFNLDDVTIFPPSIYVQNNDSYSHVYHNHVRCTPSYLSPSLVANVYLDPPKDGGELEIVDDLNLEEQFKISVEKNKIYFLPSWAYHRPCPQKDTNFRLCLSIDIFSTQRPFFKPLGIYW